MLDPLAQQVHQELKDQEDFVDIEEPLDIKDHKAAKD